MFYVLVAIAYAKSTMPVTEESWCDFGDIGKYESDNKYCLTLTSAGQIDREQQYVSKYGWIISTCPESFVHRSTGRRTVKLYVYFSPSI